MGIYSNDPSTCTGFTSSHDLCADCGLRRRDHHTPGQPAPLVVSAADIISWPDPVMHVKPLWAGEAVSILTGQRKQGKSLVLLHAALQSACNGVDTLVLLGEGRSGVRQRLDALGLYQRPPKARLDFQVGSRFLFGEEEEQARLSGFVRDEGYGAIVIDPIQRYKANGFDEDSADFVRGPIGYLEGLDLPCLVGMHTGKDKSRGVRGSSAWEGEASAFSYLERSGERFKLTTTWRDGDYDTSREVVMGASPGGVPHVTGYTDWGDSDDVVWNNIVGAVTLGAEVGRWYKVVELRDLTLSAAESRGVVVDWNQKTPATQFLPRNWEKHPSQSRYRVVES